MRRSINLLAVLLLAVTVVVGQTVPPLPASIPPEADTDKCYVICFMPQEWETVEESIETYGSGSRLLVAQPAYETITERVMVKPATYRLVNVPAVYTTVEERVEIAPAYTEYVVEEAKFETGKERVLIEEGSKTYRPSDPEFTTVTNANLYYGDSDPTQVTGSAPSSNDLGNILDPENEALITAPSSPFSPNNPTGLLNDPNSPFNASPTTYGNAGIAALLDPDNPESPYNDAYIEANGVEAAQRRANEILVLSGVGSISPYLETEARVEIDRIPREFEIVSEEIEVQASYVTYEQAPAPCADGEGDCMAWCAVTVPAQYATINRRIAKDCPANYAVASIEQGGDDYCVRIAYTPAVYGARQIMTAGPTIEERDNDPRYREVTVTKLVSPARVVEKTVPAKFETVTKRVVAREAYTRYEVVPPVYDNVTRRVRRGLEDADYITPGGVFMAGPSQYDGSTTPSGTNNGLPIELNPAAGYPVDGTTIPMEIGSGPDRAGQVAVAPDTYGQVAEDVANIPAGMPSNYYTAGCPSGMRFDPRDGLCKATDSYTATSETVSKRIATGTGNFSAWQEVLCPDKATEVDIRSLQRALNTAGYNVGVADGIMGVKTKAALAKYQKDNGLPIGGMNMPTLRALGLR